MEADIGARRVIILGAGYAGMLAAMRLAGRRKRLHLELTLVNAADHFVERVRLHQLATGQAVKTQPFADKLRGTGVEFLHGRVLALDTKRKLVRVEGADATRELPYDYLIYALGSTVDTNAVPGVRDHAATLGSEAAAATLRAGLPQLARTEGRVVVCGGGLTGIEAATEIAEEWPGVRVSLVTRGRAGYGLSDKGRTHLQTVCDRRGIALHENRAIERINVDRVVCESGLEFPFDLCLWAGSFSVPRLARDAGLAVNERGQALIDRTMRSISHPDIFVAGDAAAFADASAVPIRMACATAMPMGAHAADCLSAVVAGRTAEPFRFAYVWQCISLGRREGLLQFVHADDTPRERVLTGRPAALVKELFYRYAANAARIEYRFHGSYRWPKGGKGKATAMMAPGTPSFRGPEELR